MNKSVLKMLLAGMLVTASQPALAQSTSENTQRIEQLEAALQSLREQSAAQQAEIIELKAENARYRAQVEPEREVAQVDEGSATAAMESTAAPTLLSDPDASREAQLQALLAVRESRRTAVDAAADQALRQAEPLPLLVDGGQSVPARSAGTAVGISANKDGGRVAISLTRSRFRSGFANKAEDCLLRPGMRVTRDDPCNTPTTYRQNVSTVSLSAPASSSGDTSFATLDGLATGLKTEFRHTMYFGRMPNAAAIYSNPSIRAAQEKCVAANPDKPESCTEFSALYSDDYLSAGQKDAVADTVFNEIVAGSYGITFSGSVGYDEFDFFPDSTFEKDTAERISLAAGTGFIYFPSRESSFLLEGNFQRTFEGADDATRCQITPDAGNDFLNCVTGAFAGPTREEKLILSTQYRQNINLSDGGLLPNIAIAPRVEFDALSNDYSFDLPIFLVGSKDGKMVAGLRLGYQDENNDGEIKVGVFYGTAFDLTPF